MINKTTDDYKNYPIVLKDENSKDTTTEILNYIPKQIQQVESICPKKSVLNYFSKKSLEKLINKNPFNMNPSYGNTIVDLFSNNASNNKIHYLFIIRKIQRIANKLGIMGTNGEPMVPQKRIHATLSSVILDKENIDKYTDTFKSLERNSQNIKELLNSNEFKKISLILNSWKFCDDGNLGLQFDTDTRQNKTITKKEFVSLFNNPRITLSLEDKKTLFKKIIEFPDVYDKKNNTLTFTSLQWAKLKLALEGAEIKAFHKGTLLCIGWVKNLDKLKNHENLVKFIDTVNNKISPYIGYSHEIDNLVEIAYKERTLNSDVSISNQDFKQKTRDKRFSRLKLLSESSSGSDSTNLSKKNIQYNVHL